MQGQPSFQLQTLPGVTPLCAELLVDEMRNCQSFVMALQVVMLGH